MNPLHPGMIAIAAAAIGLPLLIHFLTRPRPTRYPLSTIKFIREAVAQKKARHRLRDVLVLLSRMLAIGLLGWAFARPLFHQQAMVSPENRNQARRVVILDVSQSMAASSTGTESFERARVKAAQYLKNRHELSANLILAGAQPKSVFDRPSTSFHVLNEALTKATVLPEKADIQAAINKAAEMFSVAETSGAQQTELVIISDFQRSNWATVDFSALPSSTKIQLESTAPASGLDNLAIESVRFAGRATEGSETNLEVVVANFSTSARNVKCEIVLDNDAYTVIGTCPAFVKTTLTQPIVMPRQGWIAGLARLADHRDDLPADDSCPFVGHVQANTVFGLVTSEPPAKRPSSSYYLERALAPYASDLAVQQPRVVRLRPDALSPQTIGECQLLVLVHPGKLESEQINLLASYLRRGRGILYVTSDLVDANNFRLLSDAVGQELQAPVEILPNARARNREGYALGDVRPDQQPFTILGDSLAATVASIRVVGGLATRRQPNSLDDDVLAALDDRSAFMFVSSVGAGNLGVINADLLASNLPRQRVFLALLTELAERLLPESDAQSVAYCGEPLTRLLPLAITDPEKLSFAVPHLNLPDKSMSQQQDFGQLRTAGEGVLWQWPEPPAPGVVSVERDGQAVFALAFKTPADESDLRSLDASVMTDRLAAGRQVQFRQVDAADSSRDDFWIWLAVGCVLAMIGEVLALKLFRT